MLEEMEHTGAAALSKPKSDTRSPEPELCAASSYNTRQLIAPCVGRPPLLLSALLCMVPGVHIVFTYIPTCTVRTAESFCTTHAHQTGTPTKLFRLSCK